MKKSIKIALILILIGTIGAVYAYANGADTSLTLDKYVKNKIKKNVEYSIDSDEDISDSKIDNTLESNLDNLGNKIDKAAQKLEDKVESLDKEFKDKTKAPIKDALFKDATISGKSLYYENIDEIVVDASLYTIDVKENKTDKRINISHDYLNKGDNVLYDLSTRVEGRKLIIEVPESLRKKLDFTDLKTWDDRSPELKLKLTIPEDLTFVVYSDIGSTNITDLDFEALIIENKIGDVNLYDVESKGTRISNNLGALNIYDCDIDNFTISTKMGELASYSTDFEYGKINTKMGAMNFDDCDLKYVEIRTNVGEIKFDGEIKGKNSISTNMGSVELDIDQRKSEIGISARTSAGSITVNGERGKYNDDAANFKNFVEVKTDAGEININTK